MTRHRPGKVWTRLSLHTQSRPAPDARGHTAPAVPPFFLSLRSGCGLVSYIRISLRRGLVRAETRRRGGVASVSAVVPFLLCHPGLVPGSTKWRTTAFHLVGAVPAPFLAPWQVQRDGWAGRALSASPRLRVNPMPSPARKPRFPVFPVTPCPVPEPARQGRSVFHRGRRTLLDRVRGRLYPAGA